MACRLLLAGGADLTQRQVASALHLSLSTVHSSLKNLRRAELARGSGPYVVDGPRFLDFLVHAVPVLYLPERTGLVRGLPTGIFSPLFRDRFTRPGDVPTVWPYSRGREVGEGLAPLYQSVPLACSRDPALYQLVAAVDALRVGRVREREAAFTYLRGIAGVGDGERGVAA